MIARSQAGFTVVEAAVGAALVAVSAAGALFVMSAFGRYAAHQTGPVQTAAIHLAEQTLRVAQNTWKYGSPGSAPSGSATVNVPIAVAGAAPTSVPVTVTTELTNETATQTDISVSVSYPADPAHPGDPGSLTISGTAVVRAPLPGSRIADPAAIPQPSGAP